MQRLLILEDDVFSQTLLKSILSREFLLTFARDLPEAIEIAKTREFSLYLIDVMVPSGSGLDLVKFIRSQAHLATKPVIVLSGKDDIQDKVSGLNGGANDYLTKPYHPKELVARIHAQLRSSLSQGDPGVIEILGYSLHLERQRVFDSEGHSIDLTPLEFKLLAFLVRRMDHILSRQQILEAVWPDNLNVTERVIDTHISNLRKKIGPLGESLRSVHGAGYTMALPRAA